MTEELFHIREARPKDMPVVDSYANAEGMDSLENPENTYVAVSADEEVVGFIHLTFADDGITYVNPVLVYPTWQKFGVGRALMDYAFERHKELRLVARGWNGAFYERLGYEPIPWDMIDPAVAADCDGCEMYDECQPAPMRISRE